MAKTRLAVIFYSMGGTNYHLAKWESEGAKEAGAEVRILKVPELAPQEVIDNNPIWKKLTKKPNRFLLPEMMIWSGPMRLSSVLRLALELWRRK